MNPARVAPARNTSSVTDVRSDAIAIAIAIATAVAALRSSGCGTDVFDVFFLNGAS